ncbi:hypothetical protein BD770DRAFT_443581 [Pilaira anomala]|nr:hypothetical protein BD770DRAFT_443581 [Pilaira anomala]
MNYIPGPKAVNIIRPPSNHNKPAAGGGIGIPLKPHDPSKKKKINLYDPKQPPPPPPLLKKPTIELYHKQKLPYIPSYIIPEKKQHVVLSEKLLMLHNKQLQDMSRISSSNNPSSSSISSVSTTSSSSSRTDTSQNTEDEDARSNRKMADLEISNQSLLKINQILETTVRQQAKQVASFKQKMMTVPNDSDQKKRETDLLILQQQILLESEEDDWEEDEQFNRLRRMTEYLIEQAQKALDHRVEIGARVHPIEYQQEYIDIIEVRVKEITQQFRLHQILINTNAH